MGESVLHTMWMHKRAAYHMESQGFASTSCKNKKKLKYNLKKALKLFGFTWFIDLI